MVTINLMILWNKNAAEEHGHRFARFTNTIDSLCVNNEVPSTFPSQFDDVNSRQGGNPVAKYAKFTKHVQHEDNP